jgi:hypothetical protein
MSGWLEFYEYEIQCHQCKTKFFTLFIEDGDTKDPPKVISSIAGGITRCPYCKIIIRDDDLLESARIPFK